MLLKKRIQDRKTGFLLNRLRINHTIIGWCTNCKYLRWDLPEHRECKARYLTDGEIMYDICYNLFRKVSRNSLSTPYSNFCYVVKEKENTIYI